MFDLVFVTGARAGQVVPVSRTMTAGRSEQCSLVVPDINASRQHCEFLFDGTKVTLADRKSANGTYLNESRIERATILQDGDEVRIGQTRLQFHVRRLLDDTEDDGRATSFSLHDGAPGDPASRVDQTSSVLVSDLAKKPLDGQALAARLDAMIKVSKALVNIRDFDMIARGILDALFEVLPQADRGFLMLGSDVERLLPQAVKCRKVADEQLSISRSICGFAMQQRRAVLFNDICGGGELQFGASVYALNIRAAMVVPLIVDDEILGVLQLDTPLQRAAFTPSDLELAAAVTQQAAIALNNAALLRKVEKETASRLSLLRFLPTAIVEQAVAGNLDLELGGRTCDCTILFSDIVGFTSISESLAPQVVVTMMNDYFSRMVPCIETMGGGIDKFMGDAILAVWGVPLTTADTSIRAAAAALTMHNASIGLEHSHLPADAPRLEMGIGINCGTVVAGNIGADHRVSYTVVGDAVNTAQRLEAAAGRGQVLVSARTWEELGGLGIGVAMPPLKARNKAKALATYSLRGLRGDNDEILLHIPLRIGAGRGWLIRLLDDGTFIVLHPQKSNPSEHAVATEMPEWPTMELGLGKTHAVMPHLPSDGALIRSQVEFSSPAFRDWLRLSERICEREWSRMPRD
ncbi:MAG TPA: adenylate/guanylate cyclase domain-containing protein [Candidatus Binatia bacterium]|jgi:adenylate cyclase